MHEIKDKVSFKSIIILFLVACSMAVVLGLCFRPLVSRAAADDATLTDAREQLPGFRSAALVATSSDVDKSPYLTNDVAIMQTNDLLLSIRNILVCTWFTILLFWSYARLKAVIFRLGGFRKNE